MLNSLKIISFLILLAVFSSLNLFGKTSDIKFTPKLTVDDFVVDSDLIDAELSPNGRYLAVIYNKEATRYLFIKDLEAEGFPITGKIVDKVIRPYFVKWANNERLIVQLKVPYDTDDVIEDSKKNEFDINEYKTFDKTVSVDIHAKDLVLLQESKTIDSSVVHYLPDEPDHILMPYYVMGALHIDKVDVYTGKAELIAKGKRRTFNIIFDDAGNPKYRLDYLSIARVVEVFEYQKDGSWTEVEQFDFQEHDQDYFGKEGEVFFGLGEELSLIYRHKNVETGFYEIIEKNMAKKKSKIVARHDDKDITGLIKDSRTNEIIGYKTLDDTIQRYYFNSKRQMQYDALASQIGDDNVDFYWPSRTSNKAIAITHGRNNPGFFDIYNASENTLTPIGISREKFSGESLGIPAKAYIPMRDGKKIRSYILFPPHYEPGKKYPMVVLPHGGPQARDSSTYDDFAQFISTRGYIVLQPNFRGSTGYGKDFEEMGYKQWGKLMQDDITDSVKFMINKGYAYKNKVCIVGASYGGYAALMGAIKTPDLYKCSVSINGVTNLVKQIQYDIRMAPLRYKKKIRNAVYSQIGDPSIDREMLETNSPVLNAEKVDIPILLIAGSIDRVVPFTESRNMFEKLQKLKKDVTFIKLKNADHNAMKKNKDKRKVYTEVEKFLNIHLNY